MCRCLKGNSDEIIGRERSEVCDICEFRAFQPDELIFSKGQPSDKFHMLIQGTVDMQTPVVSTETLIGKGRTQLYGRTKNLYDDTIRRDPRLLAGVLPVPARSFFGASTFLLDCPRNGWARSRGKCIVAMVKRENIEEVFRKIPRLRDEVHLHVKRTLLHDYRALGLPLFRDLRDEHLQRAASACQLELDVDPGEEFITQGEFVDAVYVVIAGTMYAVAESDKQELQKDDGRSALAAALPADRVGEAVAWTPCASDQTAECPSSQQQQCSIPSADEGAQSVQSSLPTGAQRAKRLSMQKAETSVRVAMSTTLRSMGLGDSCNGTTSKQGGGSSSAATGPASEYGNGGASRELEPMPKPAIPTRAYTRRNSQLTHVFTTTRGKSFREAEYNTMLPHLSSSKEDEIVASRAAATNSRRARPYANHVARMQPLAPHVQPKL